MCIIPKQMVTKQNKTSELVEFTDNMIASAYWLLSGGCFCSELGVYSTAYTPELYFVRAVERWKVLLSLEKPPWENIIAQKLKELTYQK